MGRLAQGSVSYDIDAAGRRTNMNVAGQPALTYGGGNADRLISLAQGSAPVTLAYDKSDRSSSPAAFATTEHNLSAPTTIHVR